VLDFAVGLEEMNAELIGSVEGGGTSNSTNGMEPKSKKDKERLLNHCTKLYTYIP
jgi:hypothetical protein